ncbi:hypothetical protein [Klebsiella aerogenes]|uniref:hypothetical protein n=1 Tax=Klebsiella aerogenes TaxID=548 RepID=UPI0037A9E211
MDEEIEVSEFDAWYHQLIEVLSVDGRRAPYKMEWLELYERGLTPKEASIIGTFSDEIAG